jgi:TRAP-type C4-dicarboxylate transport system permease small subunit
VKIIRFLDEKFEEYFLIITLIATVSIIFLQVVMRYVFESSLSWSEELARYIFLWQIWVGASYAVKKSKHIKVDIIKNFFPAKVQTTMEYISLLLWIGLSIFLTFRSAELTQFIFNRGQVSPAMRIPMGYAYASVPVGCALMTFRLFQVLFNNLKHASRKGEQS